MDISQFIFEPISITTDITTEIILRCEELLKDNEDYIKLKTNKKDFKSILIYGTSTEPLFKALDIYLYVDPSGINKRWFMKHLVQDKHIFKANVRITKTNSTKTWTKVEAVNMLTRKGLMRALSICNGIIAETFQDYIYELLDNLWKNEKEIIIKQMKCTEKTLESEREKRKIAEHINIQNIIYQDAYINDFQNNDDDQTELLIHRNLNCVKYNLYIVDYNYMNSKYWKNKRRVVSVKQKHENIDINSSDDEEKQPTKQTQFSCDTPHNDAIQDPYEIDFIQVNDLVSSENDEYYFNISSKSIPDTKKEFYKFISFIYIDKTKHFNDMIHILKTGECPNKSAYPDNKHIEYHEKDNTASNTPLKNVFKCSYSMILSARSRSFIRIHKDILTK